MKAVVLNTYGDINSLSVSEVDSPKSMSKDDVFIQHIATNVSPDDVLLCDGRTFLTEEQKAGLKIVGFSGFGRILKAGSNVKKFEVGQQVGYIMGPSGSNCEKRVLHSSLLINAPQEIPSNKLAACFRDLVIAYVLIHRAVKIKQDAFVMVHGVDGGVGHIVAQWCKYNGLKVIGTVAKDNKKSFASRFCDTIISQESGDIFEETKAITNSKGVGVVFDGVGESVFEVSVRCLQFAGTYLNYYSVGGAMDTIDVSRFASKSIFFGRPRMEHYYSSKAQIILAMQGMFDIVKKGGIDIMTTNHPISNALQAYQDVKNGTANGSVVITMD